MLARFTQVGKDRALAMWGRSDVVDDFGRDPRATARWEWLFEFLYSKWFRVEALGLPSDDMGSEFPEFRHPRGPKELLTLPHVHGTSGFYIARLRRP